MPEILQAPMVGSVQILSPYHCGSNLMVRVLDRLFAIGRLDAEGHTFVWKHTTRAEDFAQIPEDALVVVMVRNPLAWMRSVRRTPYQIVFKPGPGGFPSGPIRQRDLVRPGTPPAHIPPEARVIGSHASIVHLWNRYYSQYAALQDARPGKLLCVRYEDLLYRPAVVLDTLQTRLPLKDPVDDVSLMERYLEVATPAAKRHGKPKDRRRAMNANTDAAVASRWSDWQLRTVASVIDAGLLARHGYALPAPRGFAASVRSYLAEERRFRSALWRRRFRRTVRRPSRPEQQQSLS